MRFEFFIEPLLQPIFLPFGASPTNCYAELTDNGLHVKMGYLFDETLPYTAMESVESANWPFLYGYGHRIGPNGAMGVLGSSRNVVKIHFKDPQFIKALFAFYFKTNDFSLSLKEPEAFITALNRRITRG